MYKMILILAATALMQACGTVKNRPDYYRPLATNPAEVEALLNKRLGKGTIKNWDRHVSDDVLIIEIDSIQQGNKQKH